MGTPLVTVRTLLDDAVQLAFNHPAAAPMQILDSDIRWVPNVDAFEYTVRFTGRMSPRLPDNVE